MIHWLQKFVSIALLATWWLSSCTLVQAGELTLDAATLLLLHFNDNLNGVQGESPGASSGVSFEAGKHSNGAYFPPGSQLFYAAAGNITGPSGTVEFWFRPRWNGNDGASHYVLSWDAAGGILLGKDGANYWRMILNRFGAGGNPELGTGTFLVATDWQANEWHHCAFTWDASALRVYTDGVLRAQATPSFPPPPVAGTTLQIGGSGADAADGVVDELRISSVARTATEILNSYESGLPDPPLAAPLNLQLTPFHTTTQVRWDPILDGQVAGYRIERRPPAGTFEVVQFVAGRSNYNDYGLTAGGQYEYRVAAINGSGTRISAFSAVAAAQTDSDPSGYSRHKTFETIFAVYRGGFEPTAVARMVSGLNTSMEFYWRTTGARLALDPSWIFVDSYPPADQWGLLVENDLRGRGVRDHQFDLAYLIGNGLAGCLGGYMVFGSTCAALGQVCPVPYPGNDPSVDYTIAWTFTHEIHHALELMENVTPGTPEVLFCHFPWCYPDPLGPTSWHMDWGTHYDGIGLANRQYQNQWSTFPSPYDAYIECIDADEDGLPDDDPRVPMDENRFGSSAGSADTDGDGLDDLAEYSRYNFRSTGPTDSDTDNDGIPDGIDEEPLYRVQSGVVATQSPLLIDGSIEQAWPPLSEGYYFTMNASPLTLRTFAAWDPNALYLAFESSQRLRFMVSLDGSGEDGRFESPVRHLSGATDTNNPNNKQNHIGDSWGDGNHIYFAHGESGAEVFGRGSIAGAQVASTTSGGVYRTEVRIPSALPGGTGHVWYPAEAPVVDGLTLADNVVIGLNVTMSNYEGSDHAEFSGTWTSLFETHSYADLRLLPWPVEVPGGSMTGEPPGLQFSNPYSPRSPIALVPARAGAGQVSIHDVLGRHVAFLHRGWVPETGLRLSWDGRCEAGGEAPKGVYYLRAVVEGRPFTRKFTYLR